MLYRTHFFHASIVSSDVEILFIPASIHKYLLYVHSHFHETPVELKEDLWDVLIKGHNLLSCRSTLLKQILNKH